MELRNSNEVIRKFRTYVIQQSRYNLTKKLKNNSNFLYNSLKSTLDIDDETGYALIGFQMADYGQFVDQGVKGAFPSLVKNGIQKAPLSKFKFTNRYPNIRAIIQWAKERGIFYRDKNGKFAKGGYKTLGFLIARSIYAQGIKPTLFFTKPFEAGFKKYIENDLAEAYAFDIDTIIDFNIKKIK
jgi:hypothetical protein